MSYTMEEEKIVFPVIPAVVGRKHIVMIPGIRRICKIRRAVFGIILEPGGLDKDGIREHIDIVHERKGLRL